MLRCESESHSVVSVCDPMDYTVHGILQARILELGSLSLPQGIFPTQGSNTGLTHCRRILHQLSHKGSPRLLEWVTYLFSRGSSWPRNRIGLLQADSLPTELWGKPCWGMMVVLRKTTSAIVDIACGPACLTKHHFYLEQWLSDKLWFFRFGYVADIF